jgi:hypothetical protein
VVICSFLSRIRRKILSPNQSPSIFQSNLSFFLAFVAWFATFTYANGLSTFDSY